MVRTKRILFTASHKRDNDRVVEEALEASLHMQRGMSLGDIFGGNAEEFWASPDVQQKEPQLEGEYVIPFVSWPV